MNSKSLPGRCLKLIGLAVLMLTVTFRTAADEAWHKVAIIDAERPGADGYIQSGSTYRYSTTEIPISVMPAGDARRGVLFAAQLGFGFHGLQPNARYQVRATFLSDSADRDMEVRAGNTVLEPRLALPKHEVLARTWDVPSKEISTGDLQLTFTKVDGANAVVSSLEVWSTDAAQLQSPPSLTERLSQTVVPAPRFSPLPATPAMRVSLNGWWKFNPVLPEIPTAISAAEAAKWKTIQVPGEWVMQGFKVETNRFAGYFREFQVPKNWQGRRIKLRFDTVHSVAKVWVNGREVGGHEGGFVPFELDVTDAARPGKNMLVVGVKSESLSDVLASATQYATHPLGGITRKVTLFAVPQVNVAALAVTTEFDHDFKDATLKLRLEIANESDAEARSSSVVLKLQAPGGREVAIHPAETKFPAIGAHQTLVRDISIPVIAPKQWDPEHPNLYTVQVELRNGNAVEEQVSQRFGFRQVEVRGNQFFVNGHVVKLRGVCRHEVHPLLGRSLTPELWRRDAELYAAGNCNFIRTSHYPPAEEFLAACDEVGLMVECEAPLCWVNHDANSNWQNLNYLDPELFPYLLRANEENVVFNRNHPSVIIWSLANESRWSPLFAEVNRRIKALDATRPTTFHDQSWGTYNAAGSQADIAVYHYPGLNGPAKCNEGSRPTLFGEYCHLNAYNRREQIGDPGLRDVWGLGMARMWEMMHSAQGCLGGSIWAAMDDTFFLPDGRTVGYGTWGPLDGWRRMKPEYWHMAKTYSPVCIVETNLAPAVGEKSVRLTVENRSYFANLDEFKFTWTLGGKSGIAKTAAAPGHVGVLALPISGEMTGKSLEIRVTGPRGFMVDTCRFTIGNDGKNEAPPPLHKAGELKLVQDSNTISVSGDGFQYVFDAATGQLRQAREGRRELALSGPCLTLVPLDREGGGTQMTGREPTFTPLWGLCTGWKASEVKAEKTGETVTVKAGGEYAEAAGEYEMTIDSAGQLNVTWKFTLKNDLNPRQTGITFILPKNCQTLSWRRRGQWSWYPEDHIGRIEGTTPAFYKHPFCGLAGPRTQPEWPWSKDQNEYGCNDFRSMKFNIYSAELTDAKGTGLRAVAAGDRDAHVWIDGDHACLLVANYANDGAEGFFQATRAISNRPVAKGGAVTGSAQVELAGANPPGKEQN